MANERSTLVSGKKQREKPAPYGVLDPAGDSFVNPRTKEHVMFIGFLVIMVGCLVGLGLLVLSKPSISAEEREIAEENLVANASLDWLNSMYHDKSVLASGCESTLLLIRHCEKNDDGVVVRHHGISHCSWLGRERSFFLPSLFDPENPQRRWPAPSKIFALTQERDPSTDRFSSSGDPNYREIETVMPLAKKFGLDIDVYPLDEQQLASAFFSLLQSGSMCGKLTVVSWRHEEIPGLAEALGCGPNQGCPGSYPEESFDEVWQMKYVFDPMGRAKTSPDPMDLPVKTQVPLKLDVPTTNVQLELNADDDDQIEPSSGSDPPQRRILKRKKKHKRWIVYGTKTFQYFDPLQFSLQSGDYPPGGSPFGGKWADEI